ncbi:MAG: PqqD family protein [Pseudomonadota bacterium]
MDQPTRDISDFVPKPTVVGSSLGGGEWALLDMDNSFYYTLNATGGRIWEALQNGTSLEVLVSEMVNDFEVDQETCKSDVVSVLDHLVDAGLVEPKTQSKQ